MVGEQVVAMHVGRYSTAHRISWAITCPLLTPSLTLLTLKSLLSRLLAAWCPAPMATAFQPP